MGYEDTILGFIGGIFLTLISVYIGMRFQRRREKELESSLRVFYKPLGELIDDIFHALSLRTRSEFDRDRFISTINNIKEKMVAIERSYIAFEDKAYDVTLYTYQQDLCNELRGFFSLWRRIGKNRIQDHLEEFRMRATVLRNLLEAFLS